LRGLEGEEGVGVLDQMPEVLEVQVACYFHYPLAVLSNS